MADDDGDEGKGGTKPTNRKGGTKPTRNMYDELKDLAEDVMVTVKTLQHVFKKAGDLADDLLRMEEALSDPDPEVVDRLKKIKGRMDELKASDVLDDMDSVAVDMNIIALPYYLGGLEDG